MINREENLSVTPDVVGRVMQSPAAWPDQTGEMPSISEMVRYYSNALSDKELEQLTSKLTAYDAARRRYNRISDQLEELQQLSLSEIRQKADSDKEIADAAQEWLAFIGEHAGELKRSPRRTLLWENLQKKALDGVAETQTAWAAFMAFGEQLRAAFGMAGMTHSFAKGSAGSDEFHIPGLSGAIKPRVQAAIERDDRLHVSLTLTDQQGQPYTEWNGQSLRIALTLNGVTLPLADAVVVNGRAEWNAADLGEVLKLKKESSIPSEYLQITRSEEESPVFAGKRILLAEIFDKNGDVEGNSPVVVELLHEPVVEDGFLCLTFNIEPEVQVAYAEYYLLVEIGVTANHWQPLDRIPLAQWDKDAHVLKIPWATAVPDPIGLSALLRVRLIPSVV